VPNGSDPSAREYDDELDAGTDAARRATTKTDAGDAGGSTHEDPPHPPDSPCAAPSKVTTANIPPGYLAPVTVTIQHLIDGDSDDFTFPNAAKQGVRMLYINTEESGGDGMTPFGMKTKGIVHGWIRAASKIEIAVRESSPGSGQPDLDPYNRWLSLVFLDGDLLQARIVREGLSAYYTLYGCAPAPIHSALLLGEAEANHADRGVWSGAEQHNDYETVFKQWIGNRTCRPNPFKGQPYCQ
jgi:endonuclease YncB( thermonuclease family)